MITGLDLAIVIIYLVGVFAIATYYSIGQGVEGFLVNKRSTRLIMLVISIVSTNVGAGFFLSVASEAYSTGISFGLSIILISVVMSMTFALFSKKVKRLADEGNVHTIPELLRQRYQSNSVGFIAALITVFGYLFVTALQFVGIGAIGSVISDFDFSNILLISGILTVLYTAIGGIRSDFFADMLSFIVMIIVLIIIIPLILLNPKVNFSLLPSSHLDIFAFSGMPFFIISILLAVVSAFMFMELWQRVFSAESARTAKRAFLISALIQPVLIGCGVFLGLTASLFYQNIDSSLALFQVMVDFLPEGLLGLGLVSVLAILMTTVNSLVVVGGSTIFNDIIRPTFTNISEKSQLLLLRILTVSFGFCALAMAFVLTDLVRLLLMGAFVMMPMCPAIIWSLFNKRPPSGGVILSMILGTLVTLLLIPQMPDTAFGPGFLVSLIVLVVSQYYKKIRKTVK